MVVSNKEMEGIIKIIKSVEQPGVSVEGISEWKNEAKEQSSGFFSMLLRTLGASYLGNLLSSDLLAGDGVI